MAPTVQRRVDGLGFEPGPEVLSYRYAVSFDRMVSADEQSYSCREFTFDMGGVRIYRIGRAGHFYEIAFGKPGDPIPTLEITDIECP